MKSEWTLESELCRLADREPVSSALHALGLLQDPEQVFTLEVAGPWKRGGAESFLYPFRVHTTFSSTPLLLKACTPFFKPGRDIEKVLDSWLSRRSLLATAGIATPKLYAAAHALILEEFIPHHLSRVIRHRVQTILLQLSRLAGTLAHYRFSPSQPFLDLRSHGTDVVVIDFGEDLGPPNLAASESEQIFSTLLTQLKRWNLNYAPYHSYMKAAFRAEMLTTTPFS